LRSGRHPGHADDGDDHEDGGYTVAIAQVSLERRQFGLLLGRWSGDKLILVLNSRQARWMSQETMNLKAYILAEPWLMREANGIATAVSQLHSVLGTGEGVELVETPGAADIIHAHTVGGRYLRHTLQHRQKLIVTAHIVPGSCLGVRLEQWCNLFTRHYLKMVYNRARLVISPGGKEELLAFGVRAEIVAMPNVVDRARFARGWRQRQRDRRRLGIGNDEFVVLGVGQIQPRKGVWAFARVAATLPDTRFVWVGGRPFGRATADYKRLSGLLARPPANLTFTGMIALDKMPAYYGLADAFFFPSFQELFPIAVLEASAASLPLLLRDLPEYKGIFFDHYLSASSDAGFVKALQELHNSRAYSGHWRQEAGLIAARYDLQKNRERLVAIYESVANSAR